MFSPTVSTTIISGKPIVLRGEFMTANYNPQLYGALLLDTLPGVIKTEEENERALAIVEKIMDKGENNISPEEGRLMELLVRLIVDFEDKAYPMGETATPLGVLKSLIDDHGLNQRDLFDIFGSQSIVSEVLNGKRSITKAAAKKLGVRFNLPADLFI